MYEKGLNPEFSYRIIDKILIIKILEELNFINQSEFEKFLKKNIGKYNNIIFDLNSLEYINSTCIGHIVRYHKNNKLSIVCSTDGIVMKVLNLLNIGKIMPIYECLEDALLNISSSHEKEN